MLVHTNYDVTPNTQNWGNSPSFNKLTFKEICVVRLRQVTEQLEVRMSVFLYAPNMSGGYEAARPPGECLCPEQQ